MLRIDGASHIRKNLQMRVQSKEPVAWKLHSGVLVLLEELMTIRSAKALLASALLLPAFTYAGDFSYSYVEAVIGQTEFDVGDEDVEGDVYGISGSIAVAPNWHVFADFSQADLDFDVELTQIRVGGGYNQSISESMDLISRLAYVTADVETPIGDADDDGYSLGFGLRAKVMENLEVEGLIDYVDVGDDDTMLRVDGRYFFAPNFSVGAMLQIGDDANTYGITGRFNFR